MTVIDLPEEKRNLTKHKTDILYCGSGGLWLYWNGQLCGKCICCALLVGGLLFKCVLLPSLFETVVCRQTSPSSGMKFYLILAAVQEDYDDAWNKE